MVRPLPSPAVQAPWRPLLLEGPLAHQAETVVAHLAQTLDQAAHLAGLSAGLSRGLAGLALFYGQMALARPGQGWEARAETLLGRAVERLGEEVPHPSLYAGFAGPAWAVDHLQERLFGEGEDYNAAVDEAILTHLEEGPRPAVFDLISGLTGLGLYGLQRRHRGEGTRIAARVVRALEEESRPERDGLAWFTPPDFIPSWQRLQHPDGHYDLGPAHGIPGALAFLGAAVESGVEAERALPMVEAGVAWLLAHRLSPESDVAFARTLPPSGPPEPTRSKVSWCYGDLGTALILLRLARRLDRPDWEMEALALARRGAAWTCEEVDIFEPGLCHGAIGAAHMFNRLHHLTGEASFAEAALRWYEETLTFWQDDAEHTGFQSSRPSEVPEPSPWTSPGLLVGSAGLGLGLLAALGEVEPAWDRFLALG